MPLEAVMIVVDNSESSRNGDYTPTRFGAQRDAVNIMFQSVTQSNPESAVGLMSMAGKSPQVLVTLTNEQGKILEGLHRTSKNIRGTAQLATGIQVASLALKHRQNKQQRPRVVVFICSPVEEQEKELVTLAKKMRKQNVNVDFVLFGELEDSETHRKLKAFNENVKPASGQGAEGSYLEVFPPSGHLLSDQLLSSSVLRGENAQPGGSGGMDTGGGGGGGLNDIGFDPNDDPELALALRMSMEEERARQERLAREDADAAQKQSLEGIKEEDESTPLLDTKAESSSKDKKNDDKGGKPDDSDKMDTS